MPREFATETVLSVTTGRLLTEEGISALYEILNYMTGDNLFTHQLPRAMRECVPWLYRQHPILEGLDTAALTSDGWRQWRDDTVARIGPALSVEPIPADDHAAIDPLAELQSMVRPDTPIVVVSPRDE